MAPPNTIAASSSGIVPGPSLYLGDNLSIDNNTTGFSTNYLPISTNSILNVGFGINMNKQSDGTSKLTVNASGNINTSGYINAIDDITSASTVYGNQLDIGNNKCTISDSGLITIQDNLVIGSTFNVQKTSGNVTTSGNVSAGGILSVGSTTNSTGTLTVGNASASNYTIQLLNTGQITAKGDLRIGTDINSPNFVVTASSGAITAQSDLKIQNSGVDKFVVTSSSGAITAQSDLKIQSSGVDKFVVTASSGAITAQSDLKIQSSGVDKFVVTASSGAITAQRDLKIQSSGVDKFAVTSSTGAIVAHNSLTMKNTSEVSTFNLTGSSGNVSMGTDSTNGSITTTYNSYVHPLSHSDISTTDDSVSKISSTSTLLTTQAYVDDALWRQTKRLNLIVGSNDTSLATFSNMMNMAQTLAGQDAVQTLSGLLDTTGEIKTSISTVMNRAYNPIDVNCCPAVWADECPPMPIPSSISGLGKYGMDGWYFKNLPITFNSATIGSKINWYLPANGTIMKVKHLINLFLNIFAVSDNSFPIISMWTAPKGNASDLYTDACNATVNFYFTPTNPSQTSNKNYTLYVGNSSPANTYNSTLLRCSSTSTRNKNNKTQNSNLGTITQVSSSTAFLNSFDTSIVSGEDNIVCFVIQTASTAAAGDVNLVVNNFNVESRDTTSDNSRDIVNGTSKFMFNNSAVCIDYHYMLFHKTHMDFTPITGTKSDAFRLSYNTDVMR